MAQHDDRPLQRLLAALPSGIRRAYEWLRKPGRIWLRVPLALLLIAGGFLGFLPILGFWMIPLGAVLLAEDVPFLRRPTMRALAMVQDWWDRYRARRGQG
jgi:purine-cytosine permease-like protein